jgi:hypothetical protein
MLSRHSTENWLTRSYTTGESSFTGSLFLSYRPRNCLKVGKREFSNLLVFGFATAAPLILHLTSRAKTKPSSLMTKLLSKLLTIKTQQRGLGNQNNIILGERYCAYVCECLSSSKPKE